MVTDKPRRDIKIRPALLDQDRQDLLALLREVDLYHVGRVPDIFQEYTYQEDTLLERLSHVPGSFLLCAELEGRVVGFVYFYLRTSPPYPMFVPRRFLHVDSLAVLEAYRRQGIGKALMQAVTEKALELGVDDIRLGVWEANENALRFYRSLGYETILRTMILRVREKLPQKE